MVDNLPSSILPNPDELSPTEKGNKQGLNVVVHGTDVLVYLLGANSPLTLRYPYIDCVREHVLFYGASMSLCNGPLCTDKVRILDFSLRKISIMGKASRSLYVCPPVSRSMHQKEQQKTGVLISCLEVWLVGMKTSCQRTGLGFFL